MGRKERQHAEQLLATYQGEWQEAEQSDAGRSQPRSIEFRPVQCLERERGSIGDLHH
jgi:hypothetical protein